MKRIRIIFGENVCVVVRMKAGECLCLKQPWVRAGGIGRMVGSGVRRGCEWILREVNVVRQET